MTQEDLIRLRIQLFALIQKAERLHVAQATLSAKQKGGSIYTPTEIKASELEVRHAQHLACDAATQVLPAIQTLTIAPRFAALAEEVATT